MAASISFVGAEEGIGANGYSAQLWGDSSVTKSFDLAGEKYGTGGYYYIRPTLNSSPTDLYEGVSAGNDLGITAGSNPTLYSAPVFLSSITGGAGSYVNFGGYPITYGPDGASVAYRQGGLSVSVNNNNNGTFFNTPSGNNTGVYGDAFSFTMGSDMGATFRIGVGVDVVNYAPYSPDYVSLYSGSTGTVFSSKLSRNGSMDIAFFDVTADAGETISAAVWQLAGSNSVAPFGLITFDVKSYNFNVTSDTQTNSAALGGGAASLVKTGGGTLVVTSSNSYGGGTLISGGTLKLEGGSVGGNITNNANLTISTDLANAVSGSGSLTKSGAGNASLWTANSYTGMTVVEAGQLRLDGSGAISSNSVVQVASGASFSATGIYKTSNDLTIAGLTGAGELYNASGNLTVNKTSGTDIFSGQINGGTGLTKAGDGTLALGAASAYTGETTVSAGVLLLADGNGLGSTTGGTTVANGAVLRLTNATGMTVGNEALTISGQGRGGSGGALRSVGGANTWQGKVSLAAASRIGAASGSSLTLDVASGNAIEGNDFDLAFEGAGTIVVNDPILGSGQISKIGSGDLVIQKSDLTATIKSNSITVNFAVPPVNGTYDVLPGSLSSASLASTSVTGLGSGKTATLANSPNLVVQVSDAAAGPTFSDAFPGGVSMTDVASNGLTYLMNYAFGGSSLQTAQLPTQDVNDPSWLTLVAYVRTNNAVGMLEVVGEKGSSLNAWDTQNPILGEAAPDQSDAPAGTQKRIFRTPKSGDRLFLRLKATLNP